MQVILQEDIINVGKAGEVVTIKDGYARNYLLPQKKAVLANPKNLRMLEHQKRVVAIKQEKLKGEATKLASQLQSVTLTLEREASEVTEGEETKMFGSVTVKDLAESFRAKGFLIDRHFIQLKAPIRQLGKHDVVVKLHSDVSVTIPVNVVKRAS